MGIHETKLDSTSQPQSQLQTTAKEKDQLDFQLKTLPIPDEKPPKSIPIQKKQKTLSSLSKDSLEHNNIRGSLPLDIRKLYKFKELLGSGHFGQVRIAYRKDGDPDRHYAIKSIKLRNLSEQSLIDLSREVEIISSLDHPNIIKFYETYHDDLFFHIVMELCTGKELFEKLIAEGQLSEQKVAQIMLQVVEAVTYLHIQGITHRDLKPENILFQSNTTTDEIKLIDFGLSRKYCHNEKMHTILGTPYYVAPEVLKGDYDEKCDIWSIGCLTYILLSGKPPFMGGNNNEIFKRIVDDAVSFPQAKWRSISQEGINFIQQCLNKNPSTRLSAKEALSHQWFSHILSESHEEHNLPSELLINLRKFSSPSKLKTIILKYLMEQLSFAELTKLKKAFTAIDTNHSGHIDISELDKAFKIAQIPIAQPELNAIIAHSTTDQHHSKLNYSEFLIACMNEQKNVNKTKLIQAFKYFDINSDGFIDTTDLKKVLLRKGKEDINEKELEVLIAEVKASKDKRISLEHFLQMFGIY